MKKALFFGLMFCLLGSTFFFSTQAQVQEVRENTGAAAAWRALLRLRTTATVLHTTAHPDDEDGAMLTWLTRHEGVRTGLLTLNRGEGGANVVGSELYDQLGILRTEELLAAGRYYGVDQMFTRVTDFGFSKRMDETLEHWGKEVVLKDVVHAVRLYRPDVIISRFHGKPRDGHGNHQTAGLMSAEVFKAAADPNMFPEHFKEGLRPWQVKKLYRSVGGFGGGGRGAEPQEATVKVDVGAYDPLLGRSYLQIARYGLGFQRSQNGGGALAAPGSSISSWLLEESLVGKRTTEESIFEGLDTTIPSLARLAGSTNVNAELSAINNSVEAAIKKFDARQPWLTATDLAAGQKATLSLIERVKASSITADNKDQLLFLLSNKETEFNDAMNKALGLAMEVLVDPPPATGGGPGGFGGPRETFNVAIPGQKFSLTLSVVNRSPVAFERAETIVAPPKGWGLNAKPPEGGLPVNNSRLRAQFELQVPENAEYTRPYWSRANHLREHIYQINKPELLHLPFAPPDVMGWFNYVVNGVRFHLTQPAQTTYIDRPWGEQRRLLTVAPALSVALSPQVGVVSIAATNSTFDASVNVLNNVKGNATGKVRLQLPAGWTSTPAEAPFSFTHEGELANFSFKVTVPRVAAGQEYKVQAVAEYNNKQYSEGYEVIAHRDNEPRHLYHPATMEVRGIETNVAPNLNVGYVMGVGDEIPKALEQIGVKVTLLSENDLAKGNLDGYDAILIGIRATAVRDDLKAYSKRLLDYCERGGNLVYQYQTQEFDAAPYGPYPYKLGARAEEVSEEDSKVTLLDTANPIFNWPNKISAADFDGWVEERGSKWMSTWDEKYTPLLECHDREQAPQKGGLMYAPYGKGTFVYAAYAFYRQLPAGVQGGYRLFSNIISLKKRPR
ncbi:MAG: PIG-L family deacetylase [Acidobacteria bacterium]|nr:PIG-L family deacetylase [Acidobacteriota bacterium]MBI3428267.1 PIG-L family deacetylase [Acidobacteriota bacterium]